MIEWIAGLLGLTRDEFNELIPVISLIFTVLVVVVSWTKPVRRVLAKLGT